MECSVGFLPIGKAQSDVPIDPQQERAEFLRSMYDQLWGNINRHITSLWQAIGIFLGAFAILALVEKSTVPLGFAVSLLVLGAGLLIAHVYDSSNWYNRNLHLIGNIEKQFLDKDKDSKEIHPYFTWRPKTKPGMITYFTIQLWFSWALVVLVLTWYSFERELWTAHTRVAAAPLKDVLIALLPYLTTALVIAFTEYIRRDRIKAHQDLIRDAPGKQL